MTTTTSLNWIAAGREIRVPALSAYRDREPLRGVRRPGRCSTGVLGAAPY